MAATVVSPESGAARRRSMLPTLLGGAVAIAAVALLLLLWLGLEQRARGTTGTGQVPFRTAPDFTLGLFDGTQFRLSEALATGKPVVVNFWASWCIPCADEMPILEAAARREQGRVTFVGVNVQDVEPDARAFLKKYGASYPNGAGNGGAISVSYGMRLLPETYFVAPDGRVVRKWDGPLSAAALDQVLGELKRAGAVGS